MRIGYHSITWGGVVGHPVGVTSIKDLFYLTNGSLKDALQDIAEAGYTGTEVFDGNLAAFEEQPEELRQLLDRTGVELVSVYTGANFIFDEIRGEELWRVEKAAALAATFGAGHLVVGGGARRSDGPRPEDYERLGGALDAVVEIAEQHSLRACYHPHLTTLAESPEEVDRVMRRSRIGFCPDTAHLAAGGGDPAELIRRYADRLTHVHLKDLGPDRTSFLPLGQGVLDFRGILDALQDVGFDNWAIVELDAYDGHPREAAEISKAHLGTLGVKV